MFVIQMEPGILRVIPLLHGVLPPQRREGIRLAALYPLVSHFFCATITTLVKNWGEGFVVLISFNSFTSFLLFIINGKFSLLLS